MTIPVEAEIYTSEMGEQTEYRPNYSLEPVDFRIDYQEEKPLVSVPEIDIHVINDAILTAYCPCSKCCGQYADGITSTGVIATEGVTIAVDPRVIPYGAHVEIFGQEYIAQDTGAAMKRGGCRIDIFMESHNDCLQFGRQTATIQWWEE